MTEQRYAVYAVGKEKPIGTLRDSTLPALEKIKAATGENYTIEPITQEQAEQITRDITRCSPGIEALIKNRQILKI